MLSISLLGEGLSSILILLRALVLPVIILSVPHTTAPAIYTRGLLFFVLFLSFSSGRLLLFFVFFEGRIIPTLSLIYFWGYQPERVLSGIYLLLYIVSSSLPVLI